jgi:protein-S-isoprenylcysteine O-methyltransferase Ste14
MVWFSLTSLMVAIQCSTGLSWLYTWSALGWVMCAHSMFLVACCIVGMVHHRDRDLSVVNGFGIVVAYVLIYAIPAFPPHASRASIVLAVISLVALVWAHLALAHRYTAGPSAWVSVTTRGPYRFIRHPAALATVALRWSVMLAGGGVVDAVLCLLATAATVVTIVLEERYLRSQADWRRYAERVRFRLVPRVW